MTDNERMIVLRETTVEVHCFSNYHIKVLIDMGMIASLTEHAVFDAGQVIYKLTKEGWSISDIQRALKGDLERLREEKKQLTS